MLNFEEYLRQKKIDSASFQKKEPERWGEFKALFGQLHPESFTAQKLFLINRIRRNFPLKEESPEEQQASSPKMRPKFKPRPQTGL